MAFFHMNLKVFLEQNCCLNESVCFFWLQVFWNTVLLFFFNVIFFFETFGFRHFGRLFCAFSYELKNIFNSIVFQ